MANWIWLQQNADMESKNEIETNKLDISASLVENPSLSATNSLVWSPVWEANLIVEGKNNIGNLYQGFRIIEKFIY